MQGFSVRLFDGTSKMSTLAHLKCFVRTIAHILIFQIAYHFPRASHGPFVFAPVKKAAIDFPVTNAGKEADHLSLTTSQPPDLSCLACLLSSLFGVGQWGVDYSYLRQQPSIWSNPHSPDWTDVLLLECRSFVFRRRIPSFGLVFVRPKINPRQHEAPRRPSHSPRGRISDHLF